MRLFGEIGGAIFEGAGCTPSGRGCPDISKKILIAWKLLLCGGFLRVQQIFLHIAIHSASACVRYL